MVGVGIAQEAIWNYLRSFYTQIYFVSLYRSWKQYQIGINQNWAELGPDERLPKFENRWRKKRRTSASIKEENWGNQRTKEAEEERRRWESQKVLWWKGQRQERRRRGLAELQTGFHQMVKEEASCCPESSWLCREASGLLFRISLGWHTKE